MSQIASRCGWTKQPCSPTAVQKSNWITEGHKNKIEPI